MKIKFLIAMLIMSISISYAGTVTGYIKNIKNNKSIPNANIFIEGIDKGTSSNPYGYFEINLENGNYILKTSVIGFGTETKNIKINNSDVKLDIFLKETILEFGEIKVKGLFESRMGYESIDLIHSKEIKSLNKDSATDLFKSIPGVNVQFAYPNGRNVNVSIRGSSDYKPGGYNNRVLVLLDGFPVLIPNSSSPDWNSLPLESLQRIEINNSAASAQYGHNSMGGVINLITDSDLINKKSSMKLSTGSFNANQANIVYNNFNNNFSYGANILLRSAGGHRYNADNNINRIHSFFGFKDGKGRNYRLSYLISSSDIGHPGFDVDSTSNNYRRSNRLSQYLQLRTFYALSTGLSMSHSIFYNSFQTNYRNRDDIPSWWLESETPSDPTSYNDRNIGIRSEMIITKLSRWIFMLGYDLDYSKTAVDLLNQQYGNPTQNTLGIYIQSKYSIGSGFNLNTGIRYDYRKTDPGNEYQPRVYTHISPKISLNTSNYNKKIFSISYSKGFRAPSISELYLNHLTTYGLEVLGNYSLSPETVDSYEINFKNYFHQLYQWEIGLFYNKYNDMIDFSYDIPTIAKNRKGVESNGFEYKFTLWKGKMISINGNYSYLDMKDLDGDTILYRSKHKTKLYFNINSKIINMALGIENQSKQYYDDFLCGSECFDDQNGFPSLILPARTIYELNISKKYFSFIGSMRISNLLNSDYYLIQNYPMPGRTWQFSLTKFFEGM
mgnify:CR=1 FL=1